MEEREDTPDCEVRDVLDTEILTLARQLDIEKYKITGQIKIEQYRSLRGEILDKIRAMQSMELYAIIGLSVYYAWLFTHCFPEVPANLSFLGFLGNRLSHIVPWLIPVLIPVFGWWRVRTYVRNVRRLARYLRLVEAEFAGNEQSIGPHSGWETYIEGQRKRSVTSRKSLIGFDVFVTYWFTLIVFVICIGLIGAIFESAACKFTGL